MELLDQSRSHYTGVVLGALRQSRRHEYGVGVGRSNLGSWRNIGRARTSVFDIRNACSTVTGRGACLWDNEPGGHGLRGSFKFFTITNDT
jgi:hypothetical protein